MALLIHPLPEFKISFLDVNQFTYPGWVCLIFWSLYTLVFLSFFDDEMISYSYFTNKDDNTSIASHSSLVLKKINEEYYNNDLVKKDIEDLIEKEQTTFSYINIAFTILSFLLFTTRVFIFNTDGN